ncbi:uncharacterized protein LOC144820127 [Lissotriton helveticus]
MPGDKTEFDPDRINGTFGAYYEMLYLAPLGPSCEEIAAFLALLALMEVEGDIEVELGDPFTLQEVHDTLPQVSEAPGHHIDPGSWVLVKNFQRTKNDQPRWTGPHLVLLSTRSAVRVEGKKHWIHSVHCKRVPLPLPYDRWVQEGVADSETETLPRFLPFSDARVKGTISEKESDNLLQEAVSPSIRLDTTEPELLFQDQTVPGKKRYNLRPRTMDK